MKAAVIGFPIHHSLSPTIYQYLAKRFKKKLTYQKIEVAPKNLNNFIQESIKNNFIGFNVTIPHKSKIMKLINYIDSDANKISAVNVVQIKNKKTVGYNTDVMGVIYSLKSKKVILKNKTVFIYGAGGAARAVAIASAKMQAKIIYVYNRDYNKARKLCSDISRSFSKIKMIPTKKIEEKCYIYINSTSLGMKSTNIIFPLGLPRPQQKSYAFDCVYNPPNTDFLKKMNKRKYQTINGVQMFVWQALFTWNIWYKTPMLKLKKEFKPIQKLILQELSSFK